MDDERLKNPLVKGSAIPDYFDEILACIRDIRFSERRMYMRVKEIFAMSEDFELSILSSFKLNLHVISTKIKIFIGL